MTMDEYGVLKVGSFYWVIPVNDPDASSTWETDLQPARLRGISDTGAPLWNFLDGVHDDDWPVRWRGDELVPPPL